VFTVYLIVTILTAAANIFSATCDFIRYDKVSIAMAKAGVPESWMTTLGILKTAGALGLLVGIDVPVIGIAAAVGLIVFFAGAIIIHLRGARLLVRPGDAVPIAGRGRAGGAAGLALRKTISRANLE
jgi:acid phosphatase family membrane protein YuiD